MKKPIIAIVPLVDFERKSYWMLPGYMNGIEKTGGIPIMLPLTSDREIISRFVDEFDGFLFTGGQDISPEVYHEKVSDKCGECCMERDNMETILFNLVYENDKSMFGICRGIQFFNAVMGGTLYQDIPTEFSSNVEHHQNPPYDIPCHKISITKDTPLHDLLKQDELSVNSYHHQAIKNLAPNLTAMAMSEDGLIEGVFAPNKKFVWAVQWHPELSYKVDENSLALLKKFVDSIK